jgi:hypothetical protein
VVQGERWPSAFLLPARSVGVCHGASKRSRLGEVIAKWGGYMAWVGVGIGPSDNWGSRLPTSLSQCWFLMGDPSLLRRSSRDMQAAVAGGVSVSFVLPAAFQAGISWSNL